MLRCSASQPHLSHRGQCTPLQPSGAALRAADHHVSAPHLHVPAGRGGGGAPPQRLSRSESIPEHEPYSAAAAAPWCSSAAPNSRVGFGLARSTSSDGLASRRPRSGALGGAGRALGGGGRCDGGGGGAGGLGLAGSGMTAGGPRLAGDRGESRVEALLAHHAGGKVAPPAWVVRAMRALESSYERQLREAREARLAAEDVARQASAGIVAVDSRAALAGERAADSVARASAASEMANRSQFEAAHETHRMREALAEAQRAAGEAEARCVHREHEVRDLRQRCDEFSARCREAEAFAQAEHARAAELAAELEASRDATGETRVALERAASECARAQAEADRLREHARELAQGPAARPRPDGAPPPPAMGSVAEWEALREERDALVHLLCELRKAGERAKATTSVRVGGGFEKLPDYLAKLTSAVPPELRPAYRPQSARTAGGRSPPSSPGRPAVGDGVAAATHRSDVRAAASAAARARARTGHSLRPSRSAGETASRPVGILVHQQGPPRITSSPSRAAASTPRLAPSAYEEADGGGAVPRPPAYPAVARRELFEPLPSQ